MTLNLFNNSYWVTTKDKSKYEEYGFEFRKEQNPELGEWMVTKIEVPIEITNVEQLMSLVRKFGNIMLSEDTIFIGTK